MGVRIVSEDRRIPDQHISFAPKSEKKEPLFQSEELKQKKAQAGRILAEAFKAVHDMGLLTVCFDVKWNELMGSSSVSVITPEEWKHGVWIG